MCRSIRSSSGPLILPRYLWMMAPVHRHSFVVSPKNPHGCGFKFWRRSRNPACATRTVPAYSAYILEFTWDSCQTLLSNRRCLLPPWNQARIVQVSAIHREISGSQTRRQGTSVYSGGSECLDGIVTAAANRPAIQVSVDPLKFGYGYARILRSCSGELRLPLLPVICLLLSFRDGAGDSNVPNALSVPFRIEQSWRVSTTADSV